MPLIPMDQGLVYRTGAKTERNLTPRPDSDTTGQPGQAPGISTFEPRALQPGDRVQVIPVERLPPSLRALRDNPDEGGTPGHVAIVPVDADGNIDHALLEEWAATRATDQVHPLTLALKAAILEERRGRRS